MKGSSQTELDDYMARFPIDRLWARAIVWKPYPLAKDWLFWQYSSRGRVSGIKGRVDLNVFRGSQSELEKLFP